MDRELVMLVLAVLLVGITLPVGALLAAAFCRDNEPVGPGRALEQAAARRLLLPLAPVVLVLAALLGWALVEPDDSERVPWLAFIATFPVLLIWGRTGARALRALISRRVRTAATVGISLPRVVVCEDFAAQIDEDSLKAVLAHERAHAAHWDPLRVWLAQIVTDLQWPVPGARARLEDWRFALELARDDEARSQVDGADLAAAVVVAARLEQSTPVAFVGVASASSSLRLRVQRLLTPIPALPSAPATALRGFLVIAAIAAAVFLGVTFGESIVRQVFGWGH